MKILTTSVRILNRFRLYSVINVLGLTLSLACVITVSRYVHQETTVNRFIDELDRTYLTTIEQENRPKRLGAAVNINRREDFTSPLDAPPRLRNQQILSLLIMSKLGVKIIVTV